MSKIILFFICLFSFSSIAGAHGDVVMQQKEVGDYIVEFEYKEANIIAGNPHQYVFYLLDKNTKETVSVDSMFVRFKSSDDSLVLGGKLKTTTGESGTGRISGVMPTAGSYTTTLDFLKGDEKVASAEFAFDATANVNEKKNNNAGSLALAGIIGLALGFGAATLFFRKK